jgi:uncharacterized protein YqjF (DUF2071 family)
MDGYYPGTVIDTMLSADARGQKAGLNVRAHRPWPVRDGPWVMGQTWTGLLFAHWRVDPDMLRAAVPAALPLDTFDGEAWLGVTPFEVRGLRLRGVPPLPYLSRFPELNVRTYVTLDGKPGIWFFSLDAGNAAAVATARATYRLPYFHARMRIARHDERLEYRSERGAAAFAGRYGPVGPVAPPQPGTLEHWLTERYCLYAVHDGRVLRAEIHHPPWPLQAAEAEIARNTMTSLPLTGEPLLHFAERQDVVVWAPAQASA